MLKKVIETMITATVAIVTVEVVSDMYTGVTRGISRLFHRRKKKDEWA